MYLSKLQNSFIQLLKCICSNIKLYLSKWPHCCPVHINVMSLALFKAFVQQNLIHLMWILATQKCFFAILNHLTKYWLQSKEKDWKLFSSSEMPCTYWHEGISGEIKDLTTFKIQTMQLRAIRQTALAILHVYIIYSLGQFKLKEDIIT